MYVAPHFRRRGFGRALLQVLENRARDLGYQVVRLDSQSQSASWSMYVAAGDHEILDYNQNPYADFWGEKRL